MIYTVRNYYGYVSTAHDRGWSVP